MTSTRRSSHEDVTERRALIGRLVIGGVRSRIRPLLRRERLTRLQSGAQNTKKLAQHSTTLVSLKLK